MPTLSTDLANLIKSDDYEEARELLGVSGFVDVRQFGTLGADATVNTTTLNAAFAGSDSVYIPPGTWDFNDTLVATGRSIRGDFQRSLLRYVGTRDRVALRVGGAVGSNAGIFSIGGFRVEAGTRDWANSGFVGIEAINLNHSHVFDIQVIGFHTGYRAYGDTAGYAYTLHTNIRHYRNKYNLQLLTRDNPGDGWVNENVWVKPYFGNSSSEAALGDGFGVVFQRFDTDSYDGHNNNRFYAPNFELGNPGGGVHRIPFLFDNCGAFNFCYDARHESNSGHFARFQGTGAHPRGNRLKVSFVSGVQNTVTAEFIDGINKDNRVELESSERFLNQVQLADYVTGYSGSFGQVQSPFHVVTSTGTVSQSDHVRYTRKGIFTNSNNRALAFFIRTPSDFVDCKLFTSSDGLHRERFQAFDDAGNLLTPVTSYLSVSTDNVVLSTGTTWGGSHYVTGSNGITGYTVTKINSAVKFIRIAIIGNSGVISGFSLTSRQPLDIVGNVLPSSTPTTAPQPIQVAAASLIDGYYQQGEVVQRSNGDRWICTATGFKASAWTISTAYYQFAIVTNDTGKIYECVTAGTSAGSGGPTGTGAAITDGTCVWNYIGTEATFALTPRIADAQVDSTANDVAGIVADFNGLLAKLRASDVIGEA
jgi:hypothetical protein